MGQPSSMTFWYLCQEYYFGFLHWPYAIPTFSKLPLCNLGKGFWKATSVSGGFALLQRGKKVYSQEWQMYIEVSKAKRHTFSSCVLPIGSFFQMLMHVSDADACFQWKSPYFPEFCFIQGWIPKVQVTESVSVTAAVGQAFQQCQYPRR